MEKEILQKYLDEGYSLNKIAKITEKSLTTVRYWTNKHGLKSKLPTFKDQIKSIYGETRFCPRCKKDINTESFYQRRGKKNSSVYCKNCTTIQTRERHRNLKLQMIEYKGGCCIRCGYDKCQSALEFHHLDSTKKDFGLSFLKKYSFDERIKKELDKCILVCANCHREIHFEIKEKETL